MKVSVLMPVMADTPEKAEWFYQAYLSIYSQTVQIKEFIRGGQLEMIVVNDSDLEMNELDGNPAIKVINPGCHIGLVNALNLGLEHCEGDLIVRMDADDIAKPNLIQSHIDYFEKYPERHICGVQATAHHWETWENLIGPWWPTHHPYVVTRGWAYGNGQHWFINHPGIAYRKSLIEKVGGYSDAVYNGKIITGMEDLLMWIKILNAGYLIFNQQEILIEYRYKESPARKTSEFRKTLRQECKKLK